jgi:hypothetical protein
VKKREIHGKEKKSNDIQRKQTNELFIHIVNKERKEKERKEEKRIQSKK